MTDEQRTVKREKVYVDQALTTAQISEKYKIKKSSAYNTWGRCRLIGLHFLRECRKFCVND